MQHSAYAASGAFGGGRQGVAERRISELTLIETEQHLQAQLLGQGFTQANELATSRLLVNQMNLAQAQQGSCITRSRHCSFNKQWVVYSSSSKTK